MISSEISSLFAVCLFNESTFDYQLDDQEYSQSFRIVLVIRSITDYSQPW